MRELKRQLRKELIVRRGAMNADEKAAADSDIFGQVKPLLDKASAVFTYASTDIEVDTWRIIGYCLEKKIPLALPVSGDTELTFFYIDAVDELKKGRFNIDEPPQTLKAKANKHSLCVVPALCADGEGARLGYGRGYYDRFLRDFPGTSVVLCYKSFRHFVPTEQHDYKVNFTIFDR